MYCAVLLRGERLPVTAIVQTCMPRNPLYNRKYKLGRYIQLLRQKRGLTQEALSERTRLSITYIGKLETGVYAPSFDTICKIADVLGIKVRDLFPF
jgi:DNA-binding XRE family transcriptional regulator